MLFAIVRVNCQDQVADDKPVTVMETASASDAMGWAAVHMPDGNWTVRPVAVAPASDSPEDFLRALHQEHLEYNKLRLLNAVANKFGFSLREARDCYVRTFGPVIFCRATFCYFPSDHHITTPRPALDASDSTNYDQPGRALDDRPLPKRGSLHVTFLAPMARPSRTLDSVRGLKSARTSYG